VAPLTQDQVDALVDVVEGELRGLFLLVLLTGRPAREIVGVRRDAVVPLVRQLMEYLTAAHCTTESDVLLFPGLAALPPQLLFSGIRTGPEDAAAQLAGMLAGALGRVEATAQAKTRTITRSARDPAGNHPRGETPPGKTARGKKKLAGGKAKPH